MNRSLTASIRYGFGASRDTTEVTTTPETLLSTLSHANSVADRFPIPEWELAVPIFNRTVASYKSFANGAGSESEYKALYQQRRDLTISYRKSLIARALFGRTDFAQRLTFYWADHFSVSGIASGFLWYMVPSYVNDAIRPNIAGNFGEMLRSVTLHPAMIRYLNVGNSIGPRSVVGLVKNIGLNENFARELLELHTIGNARAYTQADVRNLARLLTGIVFDGTKVLYRRVRMEPGTKEILGNTYKSGMQEIEHFLNEISLSSATAHHLSKKLVQHFISMDADPSHVDSIADAYLKTDGNLTAMYEALLAHENAWVESRMKIKQPLEFVVSTLRALELKESTYASWSNNEVMKTILTPLSAMGQNFLSPSAPDGWSEHAGYWITPASMAARVEWAYGVAGKIGSGLDPLAVAERALGHSMSNTLSKAINSAPSQREALTIFLSSPEFNRR